MTDNIRPPNSVGAQDPSVGMVQYLTNSQLSRNGAGVLRACAAKGNHHVITRVGAF